MTCGDVFNNIRYVVWAFTKRENWDTSHMICYMIQGQLKTAWQCVSLLWDILKEFARNEVEPNGRLYRGLIRGIDDEFATHIAIMTLMDNSAIVRRREGETRLTYDKPEQCTVLYAISELIYRKRKDKGCLTVIWLHPLIFSAGV